MRIHIKWLLEARFDFLNDMVNIPLTCDILQNHYKLIPTQSSDGIPRSHTSPQSFGSTL